MHIANHPGGVIDRRKKEQRALIPMHVTVVPLQIIFPELIGSAAVATIRLIALGMFRAVRASLSGCVLSGSVFTRSSFLADSAITLGSDVFAGSIFIRSSVLAGDNVFAGRSVFADSSVFVDSSILAVGSDVWLLRTRLLRRRIRRGKTFQLQLKYSIQVSRLPVRKLRELYRFVSSPKKRPRIVDFVFLKYFIADRSSLVEIQSNSRPIRSVRQQ